MQAQREYLTIGPLPAKYDRIYKARGVGDEVYEVNVARLECTCPEFRSQRTAFPSGDVRRVCPHLYDKLYSTKVERDFDLIVQLFIRYGRRMLSYRLIADDLGEFAIGQPLGPKSVRAIGAIGAKPILATYNIEEADWSPGETDLSPDLRDAILRRMRAVVPSAFEQPF